MYAKVEDNAIVEVLEQKPKWFYDDGNQVDDVYLATENIYPVIEPSIENFELKNENEWVFNGTNVTQTYFTIIEPTIEINPLLQKATLNAREQWTVNGDELTKTYTISDISAEEALEYVNNNGCNIPNIDNDKYIEKPIQEWDYTDGVITKTYLEIIEDPNRENYSDLFYIHSLNDESQWITTETTIQKTYVYTERSVEEIKTNLIAELALLRYNIETGGFQWNAYEIHSTRDAQATNNENNRKVKDGVITNNIKFKTINGFVSLTPSQIEDIYTVQHNFVQGCFDVEEAAEVEINGLNTFNDLINIFNDFNNKAWPSNSLFFE